ncbi:hybrid sensor histidine kinase/response regulator transcription factor [Sinomicrobium soli]|uniref:hybrid sensor histidine kinase/response regulator transcription factor n=1 Tax=Sinomicrobium sp. N-1-3-6 TaxID=2219864 RepID=UPI000DCE35BA|nr:hybrid sensor histidine kinase/response regulator transcription factor [Sinomicrobium sp. N-1-3-6]RAV30186.1 hybrid sensor histidine kinase/response regulator [Sinomicrobium sp. N-1-3-6]
MIKNKLEILLVFLLFWKLSFSQQKDVSEHIPDDLYFHLVNVNSGLSNNVINDMIQDSLGFIWIGTEDGLNRFDGTNFRVFKQKVKNRQEGLANNFVQSLLLQNGHTILVGTDGGLNTYDTRSEQLKLTDRNKGLLDNSVSKLFSVTGRKTAIGIYRGGIQFLDRDGALEETDTTLNNTLSSDEVSAITMQGDSVLWIGTFAHGLNKADYRNRQVTDTLIPENSALASSSVNSLYTDRENNIWIGTRNGLTVITAKGDTINIGKSVSADQGLSDNDILCFREDGKGRIWIGTRNGGLNIMETASVLKNESSLKNRWFLPATDGTSVYNRTVSSILRDHNGNMWLGTPTGLNYVNPRGEPVHSIRRHDGLAQTISHERVGALALSSGDKIWIGTDGGGLDLLDPETQTYTHFRHRPGHDSGLSNNYILSLLEDSRNRLWAGTYRGGINKMKNGQDTFSHYLRGAPEDGSDVRVIFEAGDRRIWAGTNRGGLYYYDEGDDIFRYVSNLGKIDIRDIEEDHDHNLWLATFGSGIIRYDPRSGERIYFNTETISELPGNIFFCILPVDGETVLAGSRYGGLVRLNPRTRQTTGITEQDGLSNNSITALIRENERYVWLSTFNGINRYDIQTGSILNISSMNNILQGGFNIGAATRSSDGVVYMGGNDGINYFDPEGFSGPARKYPLIFEGLRVLNTDVKVDTNSTLKQSLAFTDHLRLNYNQNTFSIDFAVLKYPVSHHITYSYKLEGYNNFWIDTRGVGTANFTELDPGEYRLTVRINAPYNENAEKSLLITIVPPFWKTWPAYLLYLLAAGMLIWISIKYYTERLRLRNSLIFEKKQRQLENDLNEERLRFFTGFSHELKTPLTLISAPVDHLLENVKQKELVDNLLLVKQNTQTLHNAITKLLEFRKTEEGLSQLTLGTYHMEEKVRKWTLNYIPLARDKKIDLQQAVPESDTLLQCDIEKIEVIFNNLISNAIKYGKRKGIVKAEFISEDDILKIRISNTGSVISKKEIDQIFNWYYRSGNSIRKNGTGIGLALSKRFAELHHGYITVNSGENDITEFTLCLPRDVKYSDHDVRMIDTRPAEQAEHTVFKDSFSLTPASGDKIIQPSGNRDVILLIDDNPEILEFLDSIMKSDYDIIHATDGNDGVAKAIKYIPNLIISDVMMPFKDGMDLCTTLKKHISTSHIPIILLTAKSNPESINTGFEEGADAYMTKPFHPKILRTRVRNLLQNRLKLQSYFLGNAANDPSGTGTIPSKGLTREKQFLKKMEDLILGQSENSKVNTAFLVAEIGMSRTSLYRKIKALTGQNINEFIRDVKLQRAAMLIRNGNYSVSEASYEVGFNSLKYFRKVFKEKYGTTPVKFRSGELPENEEV